MRHCYFIVDIIFKHMSKHIFLMDYLVHWSATHARWRIYT